MPPTHAWYEIDPEFAAAEAVALFQHRVVKAKLESLVHVELKILVKHMVACLDTNEEVLTVTKESVDALFSSNEEFKEHARNTLDICYIAWRTASESKVFIQCAEAHLGSVELYTSCLGGEIVRPRAQHEDALGTLHGFFLSVYSKFGTLVPPLNVQLEHWVSKNYADNCDLTLGVDFFLNLYSDISSELDAYRTKRRRCNRYVFHLIMSLRKKTNPFEMPRPALYIIRDLLMHHFLARC